jgi:hypothetical protein
MVFKGSRRWLLRASNIRFLFVTVRCNRALRLTRESVISLNLRRLDADGLLANNNIGARAELVKIWNLLSRSLILRWQILKIIALFIRGRVALACWLEDRSDQTFYMDVEDCAKRLRRIQSPWSHAMASALIGGLAAGKGDRDNAIRYLEIAYNGFETIGLHAYASAARYLCGLVRADEQGRMLCSQATSFFDGQQVLNHAALMRVLMPSIYNSSILPHAKLKEKE